MKPELRDNLEDALKHGREILNFVSGMSLEQYSEDEKTHLAVERLFEIIGEAQSLLQAESRTRGFHSKLPPDHFLPKHFGSLL